MPLRNGLLGLPVQGTGLDCSTPAHLPAPSHSGLLVAFLPLRQTTKCASECHACGLQIDSLLFGVPGLQRCQELPAHLLPGEGTAARLRAAPDPGHDGTDTRHGRALSEAGHTVFVVMTVMKWYSGLHLAHMAMVLGPAPVAISERSRTVWMHLRTAQTRWWGRTRGGGGGVGGWQNRSRCEPAPSCLLKIPGRGGGWEGGSGGHRGGGGCQPPGVRCTTTCFSTTS